MSLATPTQHVAEGARVTGPPRRTVVIVATLLAALVVGGALGRFAFVSVREDNAGRVTRSSDVDAATTALAADPSNPSLQTRLGIVYLAEARRTADPSFFARSDALIAKSRLADPTDVTSIVASGLLALARHDFLGALALADEAGTLAPLAVDPFAVRVDALVELGRYDEAATAVDEMIARKPNVASLSRGSYVLELRGDRDAALALMQDAVASARPGSADLAYVLALLGDLQLSRGNLDAASSAYARSISTQPGQPQAELGRARVFVARGDLPAATAALAALTDRIPLPDAVALHGDVLQAAGNEAGAREQYELVRAIEELNRTTGGISVDLELARFEVGQIGRTGGDAERAVALARMARDGRPTLFADDILSWGLRRAGRPAEALPFANAAVRFGTGEPLLWWHLAAVEADLGQVDAAREHLTKSYSLGGPLPLLEQAEARALAQRLGVVASP